MLILARKTGESLKIGDNITLEIISVNGNTVKIGIEAPKEVNILRKELYDLIKNENLNASNINPDNIAGFNDVCEGTGESGNKNKKRNK